MIYLWLDSAYGPVTADLDEGTKEELATSLAVSGEYLLDEWEFSKNDTKLAKSE